MKIGTLVTAYEQSLEALRIEEADLRNRIERLMERNVAETQGRLAAKLSLYKYRLSSIEAMHNEDSRWIDAVVTPIQSMIEKKLGPKFKSSVTRESRDSASIRIVGFESAAGSTLRIGIEREQDGGLGFRIVRAFSTSGATGLEELITLDTPVLDIPLPLLAA